jgi:hypothetical protein
LKSKACSFFFSGARRKSNKEGLYNLRLETQPGGL